jgi:diguanylate cyclase (GGDEF)-like protein
MGQCGQSRAPLSLIMLDIDYFKQYNDHYGHIRGDECLKQVAQLLSQSATRSRDFFARYGGEEFVLILPECDEKAALQVAQRCRALINEGHPARQLADLRARHHQPGRGHHRALAHGPAHRLPGAGRPPPVPRQTVGP